MAVLVSKRRKKLSVTDDEFFLHCLQLLGPPNVDAIFNHESQAAFRMRGIHPYVRDTEYGRRFALTVSAFGEAKSRAPRWLFRYIKWWQQQQFEQIKQESRDEAKKIAAVQQAALHRACNRSG